MVKIESNIKWQNHRKGDIIFQDATITLSEDKIIVSIPLTHDELLLFSKERQIGGDIHNILATNMCYLDSSVNGSPVILDAKQSYVPCYSLGSNTEGCSISWELTKLSYSYSTNDLQEYVIINAPFIYLINLFGEMNMDLSDSIDFSFGESTYRVQLYNENPGYSKLSLIKGQSDYDGLLTVLSLYTKCPLVPVVKYDITDNQHQHVSWRPIKYDQEKEYLRNYEYSFLQFSECSNLYEFLEHNNWRCLDNAEKKRLHQAVYTYATSKYVDLHLQFLMIYSILDCFVGNTHGKDPYCPMQQKLLQYGIDINKIGKKTDAQIKKLGLILKRTKEKNKEVVNFCNLRNYMLHFMTSQDINDYLDKGDLVGAMRMAAFIIIMKELGFKSCRFRSNWEKYSILTA